MTEKSSPSVKERAEAIERRVSLEAERERLPAGDSSRLSYASSTAASAHRQKYTPLRGTSFQPLRPTRIFSREMEEMALQPRRHTPGSITKHPHRAAGGNLDRIESINDIRESIRKMKQRLNDTAVPDESKFVSQEMTSARYTPQRFANFGLDDTLMSATKRLSMDTYDEDLSKKSNHRSVTAAMDQEVSSISLHSSGQGHGSHPSTPHDQDRLAIVYAQYLQAMYKASHGAKEFEREQAAREDRLQSAQQLLTRRQDELNVSESKIRLASEIGMLDELLSKQNDDLVQIASSLSCFRGPVDLYMEKMDKSTFIVPPEEPMWDMLENMKEKVDDCSHKLEELKNTIDGDEKAAVIIMANQNTCLALKMEIDLLYDCKQILSQ